MYLKEKKEKIEYDITNSKWIESDIKIIFIIIFNQRRRSTKLSFWLSFCDAFDYPSPC